METIQELIPLAKELMAQKPGRKLVRLYVLGGVLALVGAVLGLMETLCSPFTAADRLRDREAAVAELRAAQERKALRERAPLEKDKPPEAVQGCRALSNRLHAS
ncbi:G0/G1 switch protein 2 [Camelus dromedarius]|uniref:G0/G1 switch protein 2 n=1 Tax=Vicugna pacos TaxID=30538 RepID=A0A6J0AC97_VICPA|nr:G0/G1 switch protein 2 [Camelus dromedarius]XP_015090221.1 G0/G1 switch protein 2 [Vicugna pacos]